MQGCCMLFWINAGSNTPQNSSCTATYLQSLNLSKKDEPVMQGTTEEVKMNF